MLLVVSAVLALLATACPRQDEIELRKGIPDAVTGGTLVVGVQRPETIDPGAVSTFHVPAMLITQIMCERVFDLDPLTGELKEALAERWVVSDRGKIHFIRLHTDVLHHDGREFRSHDLMWSLSRFARREFASPVHQLLGPVGGYDRLRESEGVTDERDRELMIGLRPPEPFAIEILLTEDRGERGDFYFRLTHPATAPMPEELVRRDVRENPDELRKQPICAGPYKLTEPWESESDTITLVRHEEYYALNQAYTRGGAGYPDEIVFRLFPDFESKLAAYEQGEIDIMHVPAELLSSVEHLAEDLETGPTMSLEYIGLPVQEEPFNLSAVRTALSQAIDRRAIIESVYDGVAEPAGGVYPPTLGSFHEAEACGDKAPLRGDVGAARDTLAGTGIDLRGETIRMFFNDEFKHRALVEEVAEQWREAFGLEVELVPMEWQEYLNAGNQAPGFEGPFRMSWAPMVNSPDMFIAPLFESNAIGRSNFSRFSSRSFDRFLQREARRAATLKDVKERYSTLEFTICREMPIIPIAYGGRGFVINKEKVGSAIEEYMHAAWGLPVLRELYVRQSG